MSPVLLIAVVDHPGRPDAVVLVDVRADGTELGRVEVAVADLPEVVARREQEAGRSGQHVRWVWDDTSRRYPPLLAAGVRVQRCHDLRLCHAILRGSRSSAGSDLATAAPGPWDAPRSGAVRPRAPSRFDQPDLFDQPEVVDRAGPLEQPDLSDQSDLSDQPDPSDQPGAVDPPEPSDQPGAVDQPRPSDRPGAQSPHADPPAGSLDVLLELRRQLDAVAGSAAPGRLSLLLAAESAGALIAAEMHQDGLPWDVDVHDALLTRLLGERPRGGGRPARIEALTEQVRAALDQPTLSLDSQPHLLRGLRLAGLDVASTSKGELRAHQHPVVEPLLEYKRLTRLLTANGWAWMAAWVHDGRFRPEYVVGGVVTGRWATSGGGALQLPASVREAVRADPGWSLVVADAAQLEPRVLAAMSGDDAMAAAGRHADLYQGVVEAGIVETRKQAKYAMLGAIYGATTGASAVLMPQLTRAYPRAVGLVERAARAGERGEVVSTWLGRSSPAPDAEWQAARHAASTEGADAEEVRAARRRGRDWGRFTRNFVVQGTAAEWALCWMAALRRRLTALAPDPDARPHLVFFLHDEVIVHSPTGMADQVVTAVREAAVEAGRLLFGDTPVDFALTVSVVDSYDQAK